MLDFRMDTFLAVCRCMNYTRAAELLNITQPAVSQHIRYLEGEYQTKLFVQKGKRIELTESGELLKQTVLRMQHDVLHLKKEIGKKEKAMLWCNLYNRRAYGAGAPALAACRLSGTFCGNSPW